MLILTLSTALASDAYYHPDDVAAKSTVFNKAAGRMGPAFEEAQNDLSRMGRGLQDLELAIGLLGSRMPPDAGQRSEDLSRQINAQFLRVQKHVDLLQEDYATVFGAALERALAQVPEAKGATQCTGGALGSMMGRGSSCTGTDLNGLLAAALDKDAELARQVAEINDVPWPAIGIEGAIQPVIPLTGTDNWIAVGPISKLLIDDRLGVHLDAFDAALDPLVDDDGNVSDLDRAAALKADYLASLAADGDVLWPAVQAALERAEKKGGPTSVGLCPNPAALGGCPGTDVTREAANALLADKKLAKAIHKL